MTFPLRLCSILVVVIVAGVFSSDVSAAEPAAEPPNIVFILVDDLRWDEIGCMGHPFVKTPHIDRVAREGAVFENAFVTTPLCSPSRANFLTGLYAHANGITDNTARNELSRKLVTWPRLLHESGKYETAFVGKWHMGNDNGRRPGFDHWVCLKGQGTTLDPELDINGRPQQIRGYVTDVLTDLAADFIQQERHKPFCLYLSHKALHRETQQFDDGSVSDPGGATFIPADRHRGLYLDDELPRRNNYAVVPQGKPALQRRIGDLPPLGKETATPDKTIRERLQMLAAIDDGVGRLLQLLEDAGRLDQTLFIVTSDHGYFYGEHCLGAERRLAYEETIRIPLVIRYPPLIEAGRRFAPFVLSVDIAPTCLELAGVQPPHRLHGRSLLPVLRGRTESLRDAFLVEYYSDTVFPRILNMGYRAVRTEQYKLIRYTDLEGMDELYDLQQDPYELTNRITDPKLRQVLVDLDARLARLPE